MRFLQKILEVCLKIKNLKTKIIPYPIVSWIRDYFYYTLKSESEET